jgi:hypothetical protein
MKVAYVPVLKAGANYGTNIGRRWSILEHMLLHDLSLYRRTVDDLVAASGLQPRLVVEALINLVRANFVEIRATDAELLFQATSIGKRQAEKQEIEASKVPSDRWISLCFDQVTGTWLRSDDLTLVHEYDLPERAQRLSLTYSSFDPLDGRLRDLLYLPPEETLRPEEVRLKKPSTPYARVVMRHGLLEGLPAYVGEDLRQRVREYLMDVEDQGGEEEYIGGEADHTEFRCNLDQDDLIVGGPAQLGIIQEALRSANSTVIIHSCFLGKSTIRQLLPDLESAAKRKVKVDLLWGLAQKDEGEIATKVSDANAILDELGPTYRRRVQLSPRSSGSHAKIIVYDDTKTGDWMSVVGSCNFLSTDFDAVDVALKMRSPGLAVRLLAWLLTMQIPAAGSWPPVARRIDRAWSSARMRLTRGPETGSHGLSLAIDADHYALVRTARDQADVDIVVTCDLLGISAETSAFVPLAEAASHGVRVSLFYQRASDLLESEGRVPTRNELKKRGIDIDVVDELHAKLLLWGDRDFVASSFNWLATSVDSTRSRGLEIGVHVVGPGPREWLCTKLPVGSMRTALEMPPVIEGRAI